MANNKLIIEIAGRDDGVDVSSFANVVTSAVGILRALTESVRPDDGGVKFRITAASMSSPLRLTLEALPTRPEVELPAIVPAFLAGLRAIESGVVQPAHFTDEALRRAKGLVRPLTDGVAGITFSSPAKRSRPVRVTQQLAVNVDTLWNRAPKPREAWTQIEGRLEKISVHGESEFFIYDRLTDDAIRCFFGARDAAELGGLLRRRIRVTGTARFNAEHRPVSMKVEEYEVVPQRDELPSVADLHRAKLNITGGRDPVDYLEDEWNGD